MPRVTSRWTMIGGTHKTGYPAGAFEYLTNGSTAYHLHYHEDRRQVVTMSGGRPSSFVYFHTYQTGRCGTPLAYIRGGPWPFLGDSSSLEALASHYNFTHHKQSKYRECNLE